MSYRVFLSLLGSLFLLASVLIWNRHALNAPCVKNMDRAYTHLSVEMASQGEAFEGAFSHAGFRHPGPALFYYLAGASAVLSPFMSEEDSFRVGILVLNCLALALAAFLMAGLTPHRTYSLLLIALSFVVISPRALFDYWNPYPVSSAAMAYLLVLVYLAHGRFWFLPLAASLGSFIAQCHLSTPPFLAVTFVYSIVCAALRKPPAEKRWHSGIFAPALLALAVTLLMWAGPLVDWWRYGAESNMGVIARSFLGDHRTATLPKAFWMVWQLAAKKIGLLVGLPPASAIFLPLGLLLLVAVTTPRRGAFFHLRILLLISWAVTVWAVSRSFQPLADYLITYFLAVVALACFLALIALIDRVASLLAARARVRPAWCRLTLCGLALFAVLATAIRHPDPGASAKRDSCELIRFAGRFVRTLEPKPGTLYSVTPATFELRGFSVFFALSMLEHGADLCFDEQWEHYVGRALTCSYRARDTLLQATVPVELALIGEPPLPRRARFKRANSPRRTVRMDWVEPGGESRSFELQGRAEKG